MNPDMSFKVVSIGLYKYLKNFIQSLKTNYELTNKNNKINHKMNIIEYPRKFK